MYLFQKGVILQWFGSDCYQPICEGAWEKAKRFDLAERERKRGCVIGEAFENIF